MPIAPAQDISPFDDPEGWLLGFIDVETTGLTPGYHEMIDLGLIITDLEGNEIARTFHRIQPRHPERLDPQAAAINGFSIERWNDLGAESIEQVVEATIAFLSETAGDRTLVLVAYNVAFDVAFLDHLFRAAGRNWRDLGPTVSYHQLDLPSMAWSLGYRQVFHSLLPLALGLSPETSDPLAHTGLSGAEFNLRIYRALDALRDGNVERQR